LPADASDGIEPPLKMKPSLKAGTISGLALRHPQDCQGKNLIPRALFRDGSVAFIDIKSLPQPVLAVLFAAGFVASVIPSVNKSTLSPGSSRIATSQYFALGIEARMGPAPQG
jgi:hypothetical protein